MLEMKAKVWIGSEKQQSYGILANATLSLHVEGKHIVDLREWKVRNTKNGIAALPPSRNAGPDKNNPGKDKYINYYSIFADQMDMYKKAQQVILEEYYNKKGGSDTSTPSSFPSAQPVNQSPPQMNNQNAHSSPGAPPTPPSMMGNAQPQQQVQKPTDAEAWPYGDM